MWDGEGKIISIVAFCTSANDYDDAGGGLWSGGKLTGKVGHFTQTKNLAQ